MNSVLFLFLLHRCQSSSVNNIVQSDASAKIKIKSTLSISGSPQKSRENCSNCKKVVALSDCSEKNATPDAIICAPTPFQANETLVSEILFKKSSGESPIKTNKKADDKKTSHGSVPIDPLYTDPRRPQAKVFACKCGRNYLSSSAFRLHMITMRFSAAYKCQICKKNYRHLKSLQKHVLSIHMKKLCVFLCNFCDDKFQSHRAFTKHLLNNHGE